MNTVGAASIVIGEYSVATSQICCCGCAKVMHRLFHPLQSSAVLHTQAFKFDYAAGLRLHVATAWAHSLVVSLLARQQSTCKLVPFAVAVAKLASAQTFTTRKSELFFQPPSIDCMCYKQWNFTTT